LARSLKVYLAGEFKLKELSMRELLIGALLMTTVGVMAQAPAAQAPKPGLTLTTAAFEDGGIIPNKYTMAAAPATAVSPKLDWTNVPAGTASFALILHDPDVALMKTTEDVLHWMIFNIPGTATGLPEGMSDQAQLPDGSVQALNRGKKVGYMGMGAGAAGPYHHYTYELFALDTKLSLGPDATRADVLKAMDGHILGKGVLVGRFHRP
jgi:Raf kinase inhibitor-like YbhB/YbcL family protein